MTEDLNWVILGDSFSTPRPDLILLSMTYWKLLWMMVQLSSLLHQIPQNFPCSHFFSHLFIQDNHSEALYSQTLLHSMFPLRVQKQDVYLHPAQKFWM